MLPTRTPLDLHYPHLTNINCQLEFLPRRLVVYKFRDLVTHPLTVSEFLRRPLLYQGRWLAIAKDMNGGRIRQVYLTTSREYFRVVPLRLGLYDPDEMGEGPVTIVSRAFHATVPDRIALVNKIQRLQKIDTGDLELRILVDDLKLTGTSA